MVDPLSEIIALLRPRAVFSKGISGAGRWGVRYSDFGQPSFCAVLEGGCRLAVDGEEAVTLEAGDFVLLPATPGFTMSGFEPETPERIDPQAAPAPTERGSSRQARGRSRRAFARRLFRFRLARCGVAGVAAAGAGACARRRAAVGAGAAGRRGGERARSGRDLVLARLVEVLLVEALRSTQGEDAPPGLLRGLADARLAAAIRHMHGDPAQPWTVAQLAKKAALSRSAFYDRFTRPSGWRRWSTSSPGAWPSRRICCAARLRAGRGRRARWLQVGEHVQHRVQPARGPAAESLRARAPEQRSGDRA